MFKPVFQLTNNLVSSLTNIAETKAVIDRAKILPKQEMRLRRQALARMTHHSTQIEGNLLNLQQVEAIIRHQKIDAPQRDVFEVKNYLAALKFISQVVDKKQPISEKILLKLHKLVTDQTLPVSQSGCYRQGLVYVVKRRLGLPDETVYTAPPAIQVKILVARLLRWLEKSAQEINPIIVAGIVHQEVAAIHPFVDGNGRTARALATLVLYQRGYDFRRLFALEDYYNRDRQAYYQAINLGPDYLLKKTDLTPWLEYFVQGFKEEIDRVKQEVILLPTKNLSPDLTSQIFLEPNQRQVLDFLENVGRITVNDVIDILHCPRRTAQYQLQRLKRLQLIKQIGKGPASAYTLY